MSQSIKDLLNVAFSLDDTLLKFPNVPLDQAIQSLSHDLTRIYDISKPFFGEKDSVAISFDGPAVDMFFKLYTGVYNPEVVERFSKSGNSSILKVKFPERKYALSDVSRLLTLFNNLYSFNDNNLSSVGLHINDRTPSFCYGPYPLGGPGLVLNFGKSVTDFKANTKELQRYKSIIFRE